jgi:hypothetical protein
MSIAGAGGTIAGATAGAIRPWVLKRVSRASALRQMNFCFNRNEVNKMEYLIVIGVVAMMALYAVIITGCLKQPEW